MGIGSLKIDGSGAGCEGSVVGPVAADGECRTGAIQRCVGPDRDVIRDRQCRLDKKCAAVGQQEASGDDGRIGEGGRAGRLVEGEVVVADAASHLLGFGTVVSHCSASRGENTAAADEIAADSQVARSTDGQVRPARLDQVAGNRRRAGTDIQIDRVCVRPVTQVQVTAHAQCSRANLDCMGGVHAPFAGNISGSRQGPASAERQGSRLDAFK